LGKKPRTVYLLVGIAALGAVLRFLWIDGKSFWLDEAGMAWRVAQPFRLMVSDVIAHDTHPPLYYVLVYGWKSVFGWGEASLRGFSAAMGVATIPLVYALGKMLFDKRTGVTAALLFAVSSYQVYFAQEARLYALTGLLGVLATYLFARAVTGEGKVWSWAGYGVTAAACVYTYYYLLFLLAAHGVWLVVWWLLRREEDGAAARMVVLKWLVCMACAAVVCTPLIPVVMRRMAEARGGALEVARDTGLGGWVVPNVLREFVHGYFVLGEKGAYVYYLGLALVPLVAAHRWVKGKAAEILMMDAWIVVPLVCVAVLPVKIHVFESKHLLFVSPAVYLLAAYVVTRAKMWGTALLGLVLLTNLWSHMVYFDEGFEKENWREVTSKIRTGAAAGDAIYVNPAWLAFPLRMYWEEDPGVRVYANQSREQKFNRGLMDEVLAHADRVWLVEDFSLVVGPDKETSDYLMAKLPVHEKVVEEDYFMGSIRVWLLRRGGER